MKDTKTYNLNLNMKQLFLMVMALSVAFPAFSGPKNNIFNKEHINVSVHGRYQHMLDWHGIYNDMLETHGSALMGVQVGLDTHASDGNWWANAYNYPSISLGFSYDNAGSMKSRPGTHFGDFYNVYLATEFDFFRAGIFSFGPVLEIGMSYTSQKYNPRRNVSNQFISSKLLANLAGGLEASLRVRPQWELALTGYFVHHSNGMTHAPNLGTNQVAVGTKLKYYMAPQVTDRKTVLEKPDYPRGLRWNIYTAFGGHSCDWELIAKGPESYPAKFRLRAILGAEASYRYCRLLSTGIGIEGNYADNAYRETDVLQLGKEDPKGYSPFYTSVHLAQYFHYSNLSVNFTVGLYTFKKTGLVEDISRCFQRIGVRYHLPSFKTGQMFVGLGMRAHYLDRSYCIEYGTGITF